MNRFLRTVFLTALCVAALTLAAKPIDWDKAKKIQTGVRWVKLELTEPRLMKVNVVRIDLATPGLTFCATGRAAGWGKPMPDFPKGTIRTKRIRTAEFMKQARAPKKQGGQGLNMIVAFNAAPWGPWQKPFTHQFGDPSGLNMNNGIVVSEHEPQRAQFVVYKNGKVDIVSAVPPEDRSKVNVTAGGFAIIMKEGKDVAGGGYEKALHPRMAYGLSKDRRYLYVITVDGREKGWSLGADGKDLCNFMRDAGAYDAINMDGGGSASLVCWNKREKKPVFLNHHKKNVQRNVGSNIGIYLKKGGAR